MSEPVQPELPVDRRALYLRWRPHRFADVVGQESVTRTMRNAVARGTVAHGYLLCGPRGTGKTSIARILYKALNCEQPLDGDPCGVCASCIAADAGRAIDLIEIDAASNRGIDDVRALRERVRFAPAEAKSKVYIVDEAHQLTAPAWDAFLKTLEEPPPHTVFVLATTSAHKVPATIVSRCQRFDLRRIPQAQIADHLTSVAAAEGIVLGPDVAERLARLARGGLRDALSILEQVASFAGSPVTLDEARRVLGLVRGDALRSFVDALANRDARQALLVLEDVAQEGADLRQFIGELLGDLRAALLIRAGAEAAVVNELTGEERRWLGEVAQHWAPGELATVLQMYGAIEGSGLDERQLLVRLELATARAAGLAAAASVVMDSRPSPMAIVAQAAPVAQSPPAFPQPVPSAPVQPWENPPPWGDDPVPPPFPAEQEATPSGLLPSPIEQPIRDRPGTIVAEASAPSPKGPSAAATTPEVSSPPQPDVASEQLPTVPSLAVLRARWVDSVARYQGNVLVRMLLERVAPVRADGDLITIAGPLTEIDVQRLETKYRKELEAMYVQVLGIPVRLKFIVGAVEPGAVNGELEQTPADQQRLTIAEHASALFGGRLVPLDEEG